MIKHKILNKFKYRLGLSLNLFFDNNLFYILGYFGLFKLKFPNFFFKKIDNNNKIYKFIFTNKYKFVSFIKQFFFVYNSLFRLFFFKIKLKGLGYRIRKYHRRFFRFFFGLVQFYYLYVPKRIFLKYRKRKLIAYSNNLSLLNQFFFNLLKLKKMDFYKRNRAFISPKRLLYIKKKR